ncbi:MAG TPA: BTAD domain-containing putative transcriptional regulator [Longimicrobium sp.]|nr:BTAD domain-containing putative transcriptional regulator [Longimicrobium sp.]
MEPGERTFLRTLGHPVLRRGDGSVVDGLRRKDLALLAYLCVEGDRPFSRAHLAALLWGESPEEKARHSLTQALRRAAAGVGREALAMERDTVRWTGAAACDAQLLLEGDERLDELLTPYEGPFLEGFEAGFGSQEFSAWADARRAELRRAAVRWLDRGGERAERAGDWERALRLGERSVQIDREWEGGHRRVMRALLERGERNLALRHFREFARWLTWEVGGHPDPETVALADLIRATAAFRADAPPPRIDPPPVPAPAGTSPAADGELPENAGLPREPGLAPGPASPTKPIFRKDDHEDGEMDAAAGSSPPGDPRAVNDERAGSDGQAVGPGGGADGRGPAPSTGAGLPAAQDAPPVSQAPVPVRQSSAAEEVPDAAREPGRGARLGLAAVALALIAVLGAGVWVEWEWTRARKPVPVVGRGEVIQAKDDRVYLVFGDTLYAFPDTATRERCLGGWPRVRRVHVLPPLPRRTLPSVRVHRWLGGSVAVVADDPSRLEQSVPVGCVLAPVPDWLTFRAIFGHMDGAASARAPERVLRRLPRIRQAEAFVVRPPGTLIQGAGDSIRWVAFHGGALSVRGQGVLATYCRTRADVVRVTENEFQYYRSEALLPPAAAPCRRRERPSREDPAPAP